ncbi:Molybdopterin synthase sulfur carrier subunit [uncultured Gammaproteobacteria bacterium]|jgi:molybdopterin synthase sulfur carrier subunit|uniref:molybdopterin converting factor subunit 1 n=1 Tax=Bathymodiolus heckerae thiotrophic gill symbiont TaxID=1052212 RepID=UPI0010BB86E2|nr:molybdopterin converting factor subunit 1 [Bathymodiolus heckerae thiotrophic gill symbiont]CAB9539638.1 Molybdopterin synthase sulfur carrier subunit [Bathymodiolus brooksi thiotrophic gill symbiont]CAC9561347.1 Molybdopterin synthase sulfur carrier subunit [uncultured Gammaproteobacteria bacterium]CAB9544964.1 Molybdopterin synthase sulfur carrier subunit [Bathymodiolus brooksi thiotrophic gill symbiont]CAC9565831.1 Molybdopterin synthase sulfur carrier subunit [uncultured Gammaproteobacte
MNILYFASLKEALQVSSETVTASPNMTVNKLKQQLIEHYGEQHFPNNILCAVNHEIANNLTQLNNNDEVAFYPPVTGG